MEVTRSGKEIEAFVEAEIIKHSENGSSEDMPTYSKNKAERQASGLLRKMKTGTQGHTILSHKDQS